MAAGVFLLAGCAAEPTASPGELFHEYARNPHVRNDVFPGMGDSADRLANLAAQGAPVDIESQLFGAYPCAGQSRCTPSASVRQAARQTTGSDRLYQRYILVKHDGGAMELMPEYVARGRGTAVLIDGDGRTYHDLAAFRSDGPLRSSDLVLTLGDVTSVPGKGRFVAVTGHTPATVWPWYAGGAVVVVLAAGLVVWRRRTLRREFPETPVLQGDPAPDQPKRPEM
ncbi:MAG TPA: hypothetical protein VGL93_25550 [Streptosporangiaceae bacterium]|jgi:hypothetical protein